MDKQEILKLVHDLWIQYTENIASPDMWILEKFTDELEELINDQWVEN